MGGYADARRGVMGGDGVGWGWHTYLYPVGRWSPAKTSAAAGRDERGGGGGDAGGREGNAR